MTLAELFVAEVLTCSLSMLFGYVIDLVRSRPALDDHAQNASFPNRKRRADQTWAGP